MGGEWQEVSVEEIKSQSPNALATGPFGSRISSRLFVETGVPVIRGSNLSEKVGTRLKDDGLVFLEPDKAREFARSTVREGDLVFTCWGTVNQVGLVDKRSVHPEYVISNKQMKLSPDPAEVDSLFLYYLFSSPELQRRIVNQSIGSSVPGFNLGQLRGMRLRLPCLDEQRAIAHILGTLDDKVELNRRMSETLEAMARALFKSWFVDFDPVRAKMEGRWRPGQSLSGLPAHLFDLFPDRLVESELGEIPEGWEVKPLSECVEVVRGLSYKGSGLSLDGMPMHNLNSIYEGGGYKHDGLKHYTGAYRARHLARAGDVLVANTEQGHDRLLIGYAAIVPERFGPESLFSHHLYRVRPKQRVDLNPDYLCQLFNSRTMHGVVSGYANGTTVNMLPIDGLELPLIVLPRSEAVAPFGAMAKALRARQERALGESRILAALRDTLLPKLVSGELRVNEASQLVESTP